MALSVHRREHMFLVRLCVSIPAVLLACAMGSAGLGGCYDLSTTGPHPEDFAKEPAPSEPQVQEQKEAPSATPTALDTSNAVLQALDGDATPASVVTEANGEVLRVQKAEPPPVVR